MCTKRRPNHTQKINKPNRPVLTQRNVFTHKRDVLWHKTDVSASKRDPFAHKRDRFASNWDLFTGKRSTSKCLTQNWRPIFAQQTSSKRPICSRRDLFRHKRDLLLRFTQKRRIHTQNKPFHTQKIPIHTQIPYSKWKRRIHIHKRPIPKQHKSMHAKQRNKRNFDIHTQNRRNHSL